jgi:hypothetical protein
VHPKGAGGGTRRVARAADSISARNGLSSDAAHCTQRLWQDAQ